MKDHAVFDAINDMIACSHLETCDAADAGDAAAADAAAPATALLHPACVLVTCAHSVWNSDQKVYYHSDLKECHFDQGYTCR